MNPMPPFPPLEPTPTLSFPTLEPAVFGERRNRFVADVRLLAGPTPGRVVPAHVPTTGRMRELLVAGARVYLTPQPATHRATHHDVTLVEHGGRLVCIDSRVPSRLLAAYLGTGPEGAGAPGPDGRLVTSLRTEPPSAGGRFDLALYADVAGESPLLVEAKSVTLVRDGVGLFPDAPTARGARHLRELIEVVQTGGRGAVAFVVQRDDALVVRANHVTDPVFAQALADAVAGGVLVVAYRVLVTLHGLTVAGELPVEI
jgi:sugar fermentation stimulation protein A